mmetsp:Transcript_30685/g.70232  ORF Transcript_30685/g.70232 Transcript_30685/m.70232 type:complete len:104 (-) Transcript_30685:230-541(-)
MTQPRQVAKLLESSFNSLAINDRGSRKFIPYSARSKSICSESTTCFSEESKETTFDVDNILSDIKHLISACLDTKFEPEEEIIGEFLVTCYNLTREGQRQGWL